MKRTRELSVIHYRRSVKRSVSRTFPSHCPACGSSLPAGAVNEAGQTQRTAANDNEISLPFGHRYVKRPDGD